MMERKFTDDEIVKALECCSGIEGCFICPYTDVEDCAKKSAIDIIDLINRQKAELESLREAYAIYEETTGLKWARAEAVKEFAKMLKLDLGDVFLRAHNCVESIIDNLVKEMTGDNNGN